MRWVVMGCHRMRDMKVTRDSLPKGTRTDMSVRSSHSGYVEFRGKRAMNGPRQRKRYGTGAGFRHFYVVHPLSSGGGCGCINSVQVGRRKIRAPVAFV